MNLSLNIPINAVSFGNCGVALARECFKRGYTPNIFPISGQVNLSTQTKDENFEKWLVECIQKAHKKHNKKENDTLKLWHIQNSLESLSNKQHLLTFFETDQLTKTEYNILSNQETVFVTSNFTKQVMENQGLKNVKFLPLGFDSHNFKRIDKTYYHDDRVVMGIYGKAENSRKRTTKIIQAWLKKYGNQKGYFLHANIWNVFFSAEDNQKVVASILNGKQYWNVQFYGFLQTNQLHNELLNSCGIVLAMSPNENWGLSEFHSVAMGKHCVGCYSNGQKEWLTPENAVLVYPKSKFPCYDNIFFKENNEYSQGNFFDFDEDEFLAACDVAVERYRKNRVNEEGLKLQEKFTWDKTLDMILKATQ